MIYERNQRDIGGDIAPRPGSFPRAGGAPVRLTDSLPRLVNWGRGPASHADLHAFDSLMPGQRAKRRALPDWSALADVTMGAEEAAAALAPLAPSNLGVYMGSE